MPADRPSREFRLEHMADGERVLMPLTDHPGAPDPATDADSHGEPAPPRHWLTILLPLLALVLGPGGTVAVLVAGGRGDAAERDRERRELIEWRAEQRALDRAQDVRIGELEKRAAEDRAEVRAIDSRVDSFGR